MTRFLTLTYAPVRWSAWGALAAGLVLLGFALDGTTEFGHHFFLIVGGVAIGYGAASERRA
jgi:hypothetical protein